MVQIRDATRKTGKESVPGALVFVLLMLGYFTAMRAGAWPPGHPWSGITLLSLSVVQVLAPARRSAMSVNRSMTVLYWAGIALALVGAVLWNLAVYGALT